jgi:hypothetical protein
VTFYYAEQTGTANDPKLVVNYTPAGGAGDSLDPMGMSGFFGA